MTEKMTELRVKAEEMVTSYNEALQEERFDEAQKLLPDISDTVGEYTAEARKECLNMLASKADPMLAAIKELTFKTIATKSNKIEDSLLSYLSIEDASRKIDLQKLDKKCRGIGTNKNWFHIMQKLNFLMTAKKATELGIPLKDINDSYSMSEIARDFKMGKTPTSNTKLLEQLQIVVNAMIGDGYKATSHDVGYLNAIYSKKSRAALRVTVANHRYFCEYIAEVCHRIVTNGVYGLDFKRVDDGKASAPNLEESAPAKKRAAKDKTKAA